MKEQRREEKSREKKHLVERSVTTGPAPKERKVKNFKMSKTFPVHWKHRLIINKVFKITTFAD